MTQKNNKPTIYIIYSLFLDNKGENILVGGIQQYILGLIKVFNIDFNIVVIQKGKTDFAIKNKDYNVFGYKITQKTKLGEHLLDKIKTKLTPSDYIIWASDRISSKTKHKNTIAIQHGITFDFIDYDHIKFGSFIKNNVLVSIVYRMFQQFNAVTFFLKTRKIVCVDYNFLNWIRTILPRSLTDRAIVIPNFSEIPKKEEFVEKELNTIKILFARRFVAYRGVYILCEIIDAISKKHKNVVFGIYGEGPLEDYLKEKFKKYPNVTISCFTHKNAKKIQLGYDISLIPTYGSEGTSLSLIESMACGCVPIASNVGGMTNVIIDGYNGFLVNPSVKEFCEKIEYLLFNPAKIYSMSSNARVSIEKGFSFDRWEKKWIEVINTKN